jgi:hypothetical protein
MNTSNNTFTFDEMILMFIHWDEFDKARFSTEQYRIILECLNDLASQFGRLWVEQLAGVKKSIDLAIIRGTGNDNIGDGATGIMRAVQFHEDWSIVKKCSNGSKLLDKLKKRYNNHHADLEVHVAAAFAKFSTTVELEPGLPSGRRSDFRLKLEDGSWLYVEVSKRVFEIPELKADIETLLDLCLQIAPGRACSLHIVANFEARNFKTIKLWLEELKGQNVASATLEGLADFRSFHHGYDMTTEIRTAREGPLQCDSKADPKTSNFATIYYYVPDFGFEEKFDEERRQLPEDEHGIIVIDVTGIAGNLTEWSQKASHALNTHENAHILCVVLLAKGIDGRSFPRWRFDTRFVVNPSMRVLPSGFLNLIERAFSLDSAGMN